MKISTFLLLFVILEAGAVEMKSQNARVTIVAEQAKLADVLEEMEQQTNYLFFFNKKNINGEKQVNVNEKDTPVSEVLDKILDADVAYTMVNDHIILSKKDNSGVGQQVDKRITGTVVDSKGEAIIGANISEKGTRNGAVSDLEGKFSLQVNPDAILVITYIGYTTQEVVVGDQTNLNITLSENNQALDEVVVIGYGTQKKVNLTGAVSTITAEKLTSTPSINLTNSMAGRLTGVIATNPNGQPGSGSNLSIRGQSTMNNNSPLFVIDGIISNDIAHIDPNEIQSISVLKDASASVYGARAANGVFLVTTKRGTMGKPKISYSGMVGVQNSTQYTRLLSGYEYAVARNAGLVNQGYDITNPAHASRFFSDQEVADLKSGKMGVDWQKEALKKNSLATQHNISVNGGTEQIRYFMSLGYLDQDGMFDNINFKRYNFRANVDTKITSTLDVGLNLEAYQTNTQGLGTVYDELFWDMIIANPTTFSSAYYPDGRPVDPQVRNPAENPKSGGYERKKTGALSGTLSFEQRLPFITEGLSVRGNASIYSESYFRKKFVKPFTMYIEDANGNILNALQRGTGLALDENFRLLRRNTYNISLNYARTFDKHDFAGLLLFEQTDETGDSMNGTKQDYSTDIKDELFASGTANQSFTGTGILNDARRSWVGRLNYAYNSKYLLETSFRYDGSYRFPKENRWGFFPSVSLGWRISEEGFFKNAATLEFIDHLKIRASKGLIGNDRVNAFQYMDAYSINSGSGPVLGGVPQVLINYGVYPNSNITWEKQDNNNLGLEASLWKGMLTAEMDVFYRKTTDILWSRDRSVPETFGRGLPNENYAQMRSSGFEINLGHHNKINEVQYDVQLIGSYATNKVTQIDDPSSRLDYEKQLNRPLGFIVGYDALGFFQSNEEAAAWYGGKQFGQATQAGDIKYADVDGDGEISNRDQKILSNNNGTPKIVYGLSFGLKWKNFDLDLMAQGAAAVTKTMDLNGRTMFLWGIGNTFEYMLDYWSPENRDAKYPLAWVDGRSNNDRVSQIWMKNAAYLRLKTASLGYTFTQRWLKNKGIENLRLYVSGTNLFTWSALKEFDPEAENGGGRYYPQQKNVNIGLNLTF
jgi:TonB-linked SusC/RagA family outer membrane protein